ncbi:MAG: SpaH/EbpB family LPXTG-anchored major pilin [Corynebacterium sp.]|nr:SpaH/EbpB family LPXTG-anchored major pilin [Corynebacterium sp.]
MNSLKKIAAACAAAALIALGGAGAPIADAQTMPAAPDGGYTLTIHKYTGDPSSTIAHNGTDVSADVTNTKAPGIKFDIYPIYPQGETDAIDLTDQASWVALEGATGASLWPTDNNTKLDRGDKLETITTGAEGATLGVATTTSTTATAFLVVEPEGQSVDGSAVVPAAPFLVTLPMTNAEGDGWLTNVHVFPKNQTVTAPVKTITDVPTHSGDTITYQITFTVPASAESFTITEKMPPFVTVTGTDADAITIKVGDTDVESLFAFGDNHTLGTGATAQQVFTLKAANTATATGATPALDIKGKVLTVTITGKVADSLTGTPDFQNTAWVTPGLPTSSDTWDPEDPGDNPPGTPNTPDQNDFVMGKATLTKTGANDAALSGAEFQLRRCDADGAVVTSVDPIAVPNLATPDATDTTTTLTTGTDGTVVFDSFLLKSTTGGTTTDAWTGKGTQFCFVETKAPTGYALAPAPIVVNLDYTNVTTGLVTGEAESRNGNTSSILGNLPLTGGMGIWLLLGAGAAIVLVGLLVSRRKQQA